MYGPVAGTGSPLLGAGEPGGTRSPNEVASFCGRAGSACDRWIVIVPVLLSATIALASEHGGGPCRHAS